MEKSVVTLRLLSLRSIEVNSLTLMRSWSTWPCAAKLIALAKLCAALRIVVRAESNSLILKEMSVNLSTEVIEVEI